MINNAFYNKTTMWLRLLTLCFVIPGLSVGCKDTENTKGKSMAGNQDKLPKVAKSELTTIQQSRILFAHKSVGNNILSGLKTLSDEESIKLNIQAVDDKPPGTASIFAHTMEGENFYPKTKIDSFVSKLKSLNKEQLPDIAFMKFCYLDINPETDIHELFNYYKKSIESLKKEMPDVTFVHLTTPLYARSTSFKHKIKDLLGMEVWNEASNVKRNEFNDLLLKTYKNAPVFDIARVESTKSNGSRETFTEGGKTYYSLSLEYTSDGGHLNELGQRVVAAEMIKFLAETITNGHSTADE